MAFSIDDMLKRLRSLLPIGWFGDSTPLLDSVLTALASLWVCSLSLLQYARSQIYLSTASAIWLDLIAIDFLGLSIARHLGESDDTFRSRISANLLRECGTRGAIAGVLLAITGRSPEIFEPAACRDTGGYGRWSTTGELAGGGIGYSVAGGWGTCGLPFQVFLKCYRPVGNGGAVLPGWNDAAAGFGASTMSYASLEVAETKTPDEDIMKAVTTTLPITVTAWMTIIS
jgi:hypothetical protein